MLLYGDVQLYQEDLKLLKPGQWLNDTIIEFYFELIEKQYDRICFVRPAIAYLLKEVPESVPLPESDLYLIPVNDNTGNRVGGSHWSLLVLDKTHNKFYHLDSMNSNHRAAASYWKAFSFLSKGDLMHPSVPQQQNGSDCGVHVLATARVIADQWKLKRDLEWDDTKIVMLVKSLRQDLYQIIMDLVNASKEQL